MKSRRCNGFSLIELLMASLIASAAGALLVGGLVAANRSAALRIEQAISTQLLADRLALLDERISDATPRSGTFSPPVHGAVWALTVEPAADPLTPLLKATISVTHQEHTTHVVTYRPVQDP